MNQTLDLLFKCNGLKVNILQRGEKKISVLSWNSLPKTFFFFYGFYTWRADIAVW